MYRRSFLTKLFNLMITAHTFFILGAPVRGKFSHKPGHFIYINMYMAIQCMVNKIPFPSTQVNILYNITELYILNGSTSVETVP
jgi:hypothetical protein